MSREGERDAKEPTPLWEVWASHPFHLSGEAEQYRVGVFASCEEARAACRHLLDEFLDSRAATATDAQRLWSEWQDEGPEPWIQPTAADGEGAVECRFVAADHVRQRCAELLGEAGTDGPQGPADSRS